MMEGQGQLVISFGPQGVQLQGPIDNQVLCYGLLEVARDLIQSRAVQRMQQRIVPASILPPNGHVQP